MKHKSIINPTLVIGGTIAGVTLGAGAALALKGDTIGARLIGLGTIAGGVVTLSAVLDDDIKNRIVPQLNELMYDVAAIGAANGAPPVIDTED